ncbi:arginine--tRNA ligase [Candidatus Microgenomates bacterium]|nr:arginine--tRNA ligase [Candidatus Microgenomates bacterium]
METKEKLDMLFREVLRELELPDERLVISHPDLSRGDYSTNIAMLLAKKSEDPEILAQKIKTILENKQLSDFIAKIDVVRPGFINFWLSKDEFSRQLKEAIKMGGEYGKSHDGKGRTIVVEYSSPNIAKRFGIGHLRSTIIGQALYNLYKFLGYEVISENHLGDWGTQFGAIIFQVVSRQSSVSSLSVSQLEQLYVDFNKEAQEKPELWDEARAWFKKLEDGDKEAREIWKACVKVSLAEFERIYRLLDVSFDNMHGESFYEDKMSEVTRDAKKKKLAVEDEGALIMRIPDIKVPLILLKRDGATTYETRDLAAIKWRMIEWKPEKILYEVGVEQDLHFRLVFAAAELLKYGKMTQFVHIKHGLYRFHGGKMSTRAGRTVNLEDILQEAVVRAKKILEQSKTLSAKLSEEEKSTISHAVGIGAVKYFDLLHHPGSEIIFSWEKMFLLTGNSAPYLQYTYARCRSVLQKASLSGVGYQLSGGQSVDSEPENRQTANRELKTDKLESEEEALLRTFYKFPEMIEEAAEQYAPNLLCNFLYDLASKYNLMYNNLPILEQRTNNKEQSSLRLALTVVTANILKTGLNLLGIQAPERM